MISDSFYRIGSSHRECQDYAIHGKIEKQNFAIISDGCSSAPYTDIGARLLSHNLKSLLPIKKIEYAEDMIEIFDAVAYASQKNCSTLNLPLDSLSATLILLFNDEMCYRVGMVGDGSIIAKRNDGIIEITELVFSSNAPCYLRYCLEPEMLENYFRIFNKEFVENTYFIKNADIEFNTTKYTLEDSPAFVYKMFFVSEYEWVAIASDGLSSFTNGANHIDLENVASEIFEFKNFNGEFLNRRCNKALKNFSRKNWSHYDDLSIAAIAREN